MHRTIFPKGFRLQNQLGRLDLSTTHVATSLPSQARVVVCGGGAVGVSVAYQLTQAGWTDVVLLEQNSILGGSTVLSAGLVRKLAPSFLATKVLEYAHECFQNLISKGYEIGLHRSGSVSLAKTHDRLIDLKRQHSIAKASGFESEILSPEEIAKKFPFIHTADLFGGLWVPQDGFHDPEATYAAIADLASLQGAKLIDGCEVKEVKTENGFVSKVVTNLGEIKCEHFVNCAGFWGRDVAKASDTGIRCPLHPCEHQYMLTHPIFPEEDHSYPIIFDLDNHSYIRAQNRGVLCGGFVQKTKVAFPGRIDPKFSRTSLPEDWDSFQPLLESLLHRVPSVHLAEPHMLVNGPEAFTPDGRSIVGEIPEIKNYFIAAGLNAKGTAGAPGVGRLIADLITQGATEVDTWELAPRRFLDMHNNREYIKARIKESSNWFFAVNYPYIEETAQNARKIRTSPLYSTFKSQGAVFGQFMGYERPLFFVGEDDLSVAPGTNDFAKGFGKPVWFDAVNREYDTCRQAVGLIDLSSFSKFEIKGEGSKDYLQYLCSNDIDVPVGSIVHSGMQNVRGGYENDVTIARLAEETFLLVAPTIQQTRCKRWLTKHRPPHSAISVDDVTSSYTAVNVLGPYARDLMQNFADMSQTAFPFFTFQNINIRYASNILAMNVTHTGEMGWVLYIPNEYALYVMECILKQGKDYNLGLAGHFTMRTLRIERFYAFWGQDIDSTTTPFECGRAFRVKFEKGDFIGRDALLQKRAEGVKRMYVQLLLEDHDVDNDPWPWGGEPIYADGRFAGKTTTTGYGYTLGHQVCLGFVKNIDPATGTSSAISPDWIQNSKFEVEIAGKRYPARVNVRSPRLPSVSPNEQPDIAKYLTTQNDPAGVGKLIRSDS